MVAGFVFCPKVNPVPCVCGVAAPSVNVGACVVVAAGVPNENPAGVDVVVVAPADGSPNENPPV